MSEKFKAAITLVFLCVTSLLMGQAYWNREPVFVPNGQSARLGTANNRSIGFVTNNSVTVVADSIGLFRIKRLAGKGYRLVYVDSLGNLGARGGGIGDGTDSDWDQCNQSGHSYASNLTDAFKCPSKPCVLNSGPWYEGGNKIGVNGDNSIGTCNFSDFVLKANGTNRLWIKTDGRIGIGTSSPMSNLEVQDAANAEVVCRTANANPASIWVMNTTSSYALQVDVTGSGYLAKNKGALHHLMGFDYNSTMAMPQQLWVGSRPVNGPHVDFNFAVNGKLVTKSLYVTVTGSWADYVFEKGYRLSPLREVELFIARNGHLPGTPKASDLEKSDYALNVADMQRIQMEKIEELYLYVIKLEKEIEELKTKNLGSR